MAEILIVEDNEANMRLARLLLVNAGHSVLWALFVVCEGQFLGQLQTRLTASDLADSIKQALTRTPEDLP